MSAGKAVRLSLRSSEAERFTLFSDFEKLGIWVWGRARIDNLSDLGRELGLSARERSEGRVIADAFLRWKSDAPNRLRGDFALVVGSKEFGLWAIRDPFGVEPLFFRRWPPHGLSFSFRPEALRHPGEPIRPSAVRDFLTWHFSANGQSFFENVETLRPGLLLHAVHGDVRIDRYYRPPATLGEHQSPLDIEHRFSGLFRSAVQRRLDPHHPTAARLSGGLDSSSIVGVASRLLRYKAGQLVPVAAVFPGTEYDETAFIGEAERFAKVPVTKVDGTLWGADDLTSPSPSWPGGRNPFYGGRTELQIAKKAGCRWILCGERGDSLVEDQELVDDYVEGRAWFRIIGRFRGNNPLQVSRDLRSLKRIAAQRVKISSVIPARISIEPWWLSCAQDADLLTDVEDEDCSEALPGSLQRAVWNGMTEASAPWVVERLQLYAEEEGLGFRFPFLDRDLVDFVLSLPWASRGSHPGNRWLQRDGLRRWLPAKIAVREKVKFNLASVDRTAAMLPLLAEMFNGSSWLSAPYVAQSEARTELARLQSLPRTERLWRPWLALYRIGCLEAWLRAHERVQCPVRRK